MISYREHPRQGRVRDPEGDPENRTVGVEPKVALGHSDRRAREIRRRIQGKAQRWAGQVPVTSFDQ